MREKLYYTLDSGNDIITHRKPPDSEHWTCLLPVKRERRRREVVAAGIKFAKVSKICGCSAPWDARTTKHSQSEYWLRFKKIRCCKTADRADLVALFISTVDREWKRLRG